MKCDECNYCHEKFSGFSIYDCPNCGSGDVCQIMDDKLCGWQPKGKAEDVPRPPKFKPANTDQLSIEKLQEQLNTAKKALTALAHAECYTCGEKFEDNNCEFCSFAYPFCSQECYDNYMKNEGSGDE